MNKSEIFSDYRGSGLLGRKTQTGAGRVQMRNKWFIESLLGCGARKLFLAALVLMLTVSGFAGMSEAPKSFSLKDNSQEQVERKILPKVDTERLLAEDR